MLPRKAPSLNCAVIHGSWPIFIMILAGKSKTVKAVVVNICSKHNIFFALVPVNYGVVQLTSPETWDVVLSGVAILAHHAILLGDLSGRLVNAEASR